MQARAVGLGAPRIVDYDYKPVVFQVRHKQVFDNIGTGQAAHRARKDQNVPLRPGQLCCSPSSLVYRLLPGGIGRLGVGKRKMLLRIALAFLGAAKDQGTPGNRQMPRAPIDRQRSRGREIVRPVGGVKAKKAQRGLIVFRNADRIHANATILHLSLIHI